MDDSKTFYPVQFFGGPLDGLTAKARVVDDVPEFALPGDAGEHFRLIASKPFGEDLILVFEIIATGSTQVYGSWSRGFWHCAKLSVAACGK